MSLRDRQKQVARDLILQATADLIVESGLELLSLADVADRAGVSKRTLYNYFDSRETLLAELGRRSDEMTLELGGTLVPEGLDNLPETVRAVWLTWAAQGTIFQAMTMIDAASSPTGVSDARRRRRAAILRAITDVRPDLSPEAADELAATFHAIGSANLFERLTAADGMSAERAAAQAAWIVAAMRTALENNTQPEGIPT